jgi:hypothetical protein
MFLCTAGAEKWMTSVDMSCALGQVSHKLTEDHHADPRLSVASDILISLGLSQCDDLW